MVNFDGGFSGRPVTLRLIVNQDAQNISGNYSTLGFRLEAIKTGNTTAWNNNPAYYVIRINGAEWSGSFTYNFNGGIGQVIVLREWAQTDVGHNSDGAKDVNVYADASDPSGYLGFASAGGWMTLTTIPRATDPNWSGNFEAGVAKTINLPRASGGFVHTVDYYFGAASGQIGTNLGTSVSWTPPMSLLNQMPNNASATGTFVVSTYNGFGGPLIGQVHDTFTLVAPASVLPDFTTITHSEATSGVAANVGKYVQGISKLNLAITGAVGIYGSTISSYKIEVSGQTLNAASGVTPSPLTVAGASVVITGTITDSRGRSRVKTVTIEVLAYTPPTITAVTGTRALADGTPNDDGTFVRVNINAAVQSLMNTTQRNAIVYKIYSKLRTDSTFTLKDTTTPGGITFNGFEAVGTYALTSAYDFRVEVLDDFATTAFQFSLGVATVFQHWNSNLGVGLGKYHTQGFLDVMGAIFQNDGKAVLDISMLRGTVAQRDAFWGAAPGTLANRIALQNKGAEWLLIDTGIVARQIYLAEYDVTLNPSGPTSGAGWYIIERRTAGINNTRTKLLFDNTNSTYPSNTTTTGNGNVTLSYPLTLTYPELVRIVVRYDWYSGGNAAGSEMLRIASTTGELLDAQRTNNVGTTSLVVPVNLDVQAYMPSGLTTLVVASNHEGASAARTMNNRELKVYAA